jgi:quinol monooxygenase YgiN
MMAVSFSAGTSTVLLHGQHGKACTWQHEGEAVPRPSGIVHRATVPIPAPSIGPDRAWTAAVVVDHHPVMLIVAGYLLVPPDARDRYLEVATIATRLGRAADGCLDFVQAADPVEPDRIVIYERWVSEVDLLAFRNSDPDPNAPELPQILAAEVMRYEIDSVGPA